MKITSEAQADALSLLDAATTAVDTFADRRRLILGAGDRSTLAAAVVIALAHRSTAAQQASPSPNQAATIDELRVALESIPTAAATSEHVDRLSSALRQAGERRTAASANRDQVRILEAAAEEDLIRALSREFFEKFSAMAAAVRTVAAALGIEIGAERRDATT
jgi:hypothetical protein